MRITKDKAADRLSARQAPAAVCASGETVVFETRDCYDDSDITEENPMGTKAGALENPATGPLYVEGAQPGDILKVEIEAIALRDYGIMRTSTTGGAFCHLYTERTARRFFFSRHPQTGHPGFWFDADLWLDVDPMIGVIGTAPAGEGILSVTPGPHGGNMDCKRIREGSILYLPVFTPGGLLSVGDIHALMGDGETGICGLETAGEVTVRVTVIKEAEKRGDPDGFRLFQAMRTALPLLIEGGQIMTIQSAQTLDEASLLAANRMREMVAAAAGMDLVNSGMAMSLLGDLAVCQIVNPLKTVRCAFPLAVLARYGVCLD